MIKTGKRLAMQPLESTFQSFDTTRFNYLEWRNSPHPDTVIIAIHGFCGAAVDFSGFAQHLLDQQSDLCIYAYNLRGMGLDPVSNRHGDIEQADYWVRDLLEFTKQIKSHHPTAIIHWCGESLGAIIATHATTTKPTLTDGLILLAPVVKIGNQVAAWKITLARLVAKMCPHFRVPLDLFTGDKKIQVTQGASDHTQQSITNAWHVESFTLQLLGTILQMIQSMHERASHITQPTIVLNGCKDFFTPNESIEQWIELFPEQTKLSHKTFLESYHLLLYDTHRDAIFDTVSDWISDFPVASVGDSRHL